MSPFESSSQAVLAALKTLNSIADSLCLEQCASDHQDSLPSLLYTEQHLTTLTQLLSQGFSSTINQQRVTLVAALITKTCHKEWQRKLLTQLGILDALANQLSGFLVDVLVYASLPQLSDKRSALASILEAVGTIVQNSKFRATQFLAAPAFAAVLPREESEESSESERKASRWTSNMLNPPSGPSTPPYQLEALTSQMPLASHRVSTGSTTGHLPSGPSGGFGKLAQLSRTFAPAVEVSQSHNNEFTENDESRLITWLIRLARAASGVLRLMAVWILALFHRLGLVSRRVETAFAYLLMPILVRMLEKDSRIAPTDKNHPTARTLRSPDWLIKEQAPAVLAMLAVESPELQRAAVDAGVIKKLSQLLKESYDPLPHRSSSSLWTPQPNDSDNSDYQSKSSRLGALGLSPVEYHITRMREEVLKGLAAIASLKDEYRKDIIENGVVPFVIESLKPSNVVSSSGAPELRREASNDRNNLVGNPHAVILAACAAARGLSRSVSTLRTSLMDAGLAAPLFVLLQHQETDIQIAATAVICNLVLEFSPMREVGSVSKVLGRRANYNTPGYN